MPGLYAWQYQARFSLLVGFHRSLDTILALCPPSLSRSPAQGWSPVGAAQAPSRDHRRFHNAALTRSAINESVETVRQKNTSALWGPWWPSWSAGWLEIASFRSAEKMKYSMIRGRIISGYVNLWWKVLFLFWLNLMEFFWGWRNYIWNYDCKKWL